MTEVVAVSWTLRIAITDDDVLMRIVTMLDRDGDETDDPQDAVAAVAAHPDGTWWSIDLLISQQQVTH